MPGDGERKLKSSLCPKSALKFFRSWGEKLRNDISRRFVMRHPCASPFTPAISLTSPAPAAPATGSKRHLPINFTHRETDSQRPSTLPRSDGGRAGIYIQSWDSAHDLALSCSGGPEALGLRDSRTGSQVRLTAGLLVYSSNITSPGSGILWAIKVELATVQ